jgi:quaternary ammonium compound-resistance protein SugE
MYSKDCDVSRRNKNKVSIEELEIMAWIQLIIAGLLEIFWAISLKYTDGFSKLWPSVLTICGMIASFYFLAQALKTIPVGTGYAIWTGIGAAGTAILGIILFSELASLPRLLCIGLIVAGIIGLKATSG